MHPSLFVPHWIFSYDFLAFPMASMYNKTMNADRGISMEGIP